MECRIDIRAADRLDEGASGVVVVIALLVITAKRSIYRTFRVFTRHNRHRGFVVGFFRFVARTFQGNRGGGLEARESPARIAARQIDELVHHVIGNLNRVPEPARGLQRPRKQTADILALKRFELEQ